MKRFIDIPGSGAIKARRSHFWSQSHFSSIYSFTESEIEIKSEIVSIFMALEPERSKCLVVTTIHFSSIYSFTESEIEIKSEIVSIFMALEPERSKCLVVTTIPSPISSSGKIMVQSGQDE